jgi:adenylate cyclase
MATPPDTDAAAPKRELAAIMFSDIASYTAIMGRDEQEGLDARNSHRELLRTILPRFNGRLLGDLGDGALSSFHSAIDAVNCARALQAATGNNPQFRIRVGIHVGDVLFSDNTVLGDGVNVASRIVALAEPGRICISERVYEEIRNQRGMGVKSLGQKNLKNVSRPIGVYILSEGPDSTAAAESPAPTSRMKRGVALAGLGAIAIAALAYVAVTRRAPGPNSVTTLASSPHVIRSIAVLPLDNYSGDPKQEYFADGMTDELTTDLATISQLRVISRGSVMQFKGEHRPPTPQIAKLLDVDAVVEGSVLRVGDKVRITAQLIDAPADKHMWAKSYERDSRDVLALQDELASAIAREINVQLTPGERSRLTSAPTVNPQAHDAYLKGRYFFNRPSDENLKKAIAQFEEATRLDPNFAPAYSGLSDAYLWAGYNEGVFTAAEAMPKAKAAAEKAIQLDDTSAEAHTSLAVFKLFYEFDWAGCEHEFRRAFTLNPNYAFAHDQLGLALALQGRLDEGVAEGKRAIELDPLSPEITIDVATALAWQGKYEAAKQQARKAGDLDPTFFLPFYMTGWIDIQAGKISDAIPELQKANVMDSPTWVAALLGYAYGASGDRTHAMAAIGEQNRRSLHGYVEPWNLAIIYLGLGDRQRALDGLEKAYTAHSELMAWIKMDRIFDPLRSEPRFIALMKKVNLEK